VVAAVTKVEVIDATLASVLPLKVSSVISGAPLGA
jgi:hypothetical protein